MRQISKEPQMKAKLAEIATVRNATQYGYSINKITFAAKLMGFTMYDYKYDRFARHWTLRAQSKFNRINEEIS